MFLLKNENEGAGGWEKQKSQNQCLIVVFDEKQAFVPFSFSVIGPISKTVDHSSFSAVVDKLPWFKADNTW